MSYKVGGIEVLLRQPPPVDAPDSHYNGFQPSTTTLPKGFKRDASCHQFEVDTIYERDVEVPMRDGTKLRADVFRPAAEGEKYPILMAYSPYGKSGTGCLFLDIIPGRMGVPKDRLSGFESWEAFDPAEWTAYGYAVVNVDARGIFDSEGIHRWFGKGEGEDGHDAIEFFGQLPWCTGQVALMGNSWLGSCQWFIAAERPPHLSCILLLEGLSDFYRESLCRGGIPSLPFWGFLRNAFFSRNPDEDVLEMLQKYPLMNEYWEDKRGKADLIQVPSYVLASMSSSLHTVGSCRGFEDIPHDQKWFRMHSTQEWYDLYDKNNVNDFKKFLDYHTKGVQNDWEQTPRARVSILRYNQPALENVPFKDWPVPGTRTLRLYLSSQGQLRPEESTSEENVSYQADDPGHQTDNDPEEMVFVHTFDEPTTLINTSRAILWMSCPDHDDLDVYVQVRKADKDGKLLRHVNAPIQDLGLRSEDEVELVNPLVYLGPTGILRASHRAIDPKLSKPHWPAHDHTRQEKIPPGEVVRLEIGIWPGAVQFEKGEKLVLKVSGHYMTLAEFPPLRGQFLTGNVGRHVLHFGGQYDSRIEIETLEG